MQPFRVRLYIIQPLPLGSNRGFTLIELLVVITIVAILASISMAIHGHARVQGNEASAIATLTAINQGQFAFAQACGNQHYAATLAALAVPVPTTGHAFLSPDLAADPLAKSGYEFALTGTPLNLEYQSCTGNALLERYSVTADPLRPGFSGRRFFATNADRIIYVDSASFAGEMPETGAPPHGAELK
jgi:prepilin-type N-terminal cleavage/methylation domain-containing protein